MAADDDGFLARWSRRKVQAKQGPVEDAPVPPPAMAAPVAAAAPAAAVAEAPPPPPPPPTLEEARALTPEAEDFGRFVRPEVAPEVRHTALKTLFSDPHFNRMDGLDVYIDDYGKPDPLPASMLRRMTQAAFLQLVDDEPQATAPPQAPLPDTPPAHTPAPDEDPDLRLQPDDAAGPSGPGPGPGEDAGRQP